MTSPGSDARKRLRKKLEGRESWPILTPGIHDTLSARLVERAGFGAAVLGGYAVSATRLGRPDAGYLQLDDMVDVTRRITARSDVAVIVDCDTGWGNAVNVMRTVAEMITAGAAAIFIEDQVSPKRCGHVAGKMVIPAEEFIGKLRAADRVRRELAPDLILIARCDARGVAGGSIDEVIRRGQLYRSAGADVFFPEALLSVEEVERCALEVGLPLVYNLSLLGVSPMISEDELARLGVFIVFLPSLVLQAATAAAVDVLDRVRAGSLAAMSEVRNELRAHPVVSDMHGLVGFPEVMALENDLLPTEQQLARYTGSIGYRPSGG